MQHFLRKRYDIDIQILTFFICKALWCQGKGGDFRA